MKRSRRAVVVVLALSLLLGGSAALGSQALEVLHLTLEANRAHALDPEARAPEAEPGRAELTAPEGGARAPRVKVQRRQLAGLSYLEISPLDADDRTPLPMIVYIHGRGDDPAPPEPGETFLDLDVPVRVLMPRAPEPFGEGFAWMPVSARDGESPALNAGIERSTERLRDLIARARTRYAMQGQPIVMGFSQGGMLALNLALRHPELVGFAIPMAGWLPPSLQPGERDPYQRYPDIRMIHGSADPILRIERTRAAVQHLQSKRYPVRLIEIDALGHSSNRAMRDQVRAWLEEALERTSHEEDGSSMS